MTNKFITFVSYCTTGHYEQVMKSYLLPSLIKLKLPCYIETIASEKSWEKNTKIKPHFILKCLDMFKSDFIVFVDADAIINQYPKLFYEIDEKYDIGVHNLDWNLQYGKEGKELLSGTLYFKNNGKVRQIIKDWIKYSINYSWEQNALKELLAMNENITMYPLPREYCYIETIPNGNPPKVVIKTPIISHYQEGRIVKKNNIKI